MNSFPIFELNDKAEIIAGQSPPSNTYNSEGMGVPFFQGKADFGYIYPTVRYYCLAPKKMAEKGDILISVRAPVGPTNICNIDACIGRGLSAIRTNSDLDSKYLIYYLRFIEPKLSGQGVGSTFSAITQKDLKKLKIPLPPLEEQKRIASILDKADELRQKRKKTIEKLDELIQSIFLDMFGDPVTNPKGWLQGRIGDVVKSVKYGTSQKAFETGKYPVLRMNNLTYTGEMDYSSLKYIDLKSDNLDKYIVKKGDLLFNRTNSKELVGKTAIYDSDDIMVIAGYLLRVRMNNSANPHYISAYLNSVFGKKVLFHMCKNIIGMANINAKEFQTIKILIPPKSLQDEFENRIVTINTIKVKERKGAEMVKKLFNSLSQRSFKGEL